MAPTIRANYASCNPKTPSLIITVISTDFCVIMDEQRVMITGLSLCFFFVVNGDFFSTSNLYSWNRLAMNSIRRV